MPHRSLHSMRASLALGAALVICGVGMAPLPAAAQIETEVKVESVKPEKEKHATLRFLKANRDFIRGRYDLLRETPVEGEGRPLALDPRYLAYPQLLARIIAAEDSLALASEAADRRELLESITRLADLDTDLDRMEKLLAEQKERLGVLEANFTGTQRTALMVVVSGWSAAAPVTQVVVRLEDGQILTIPLGEAQRDALEHGGVVQVFHGYVEPRSQVLEVSIGGSAWPSGDTGFVTLAPPRDHLTLLRLDFSGLDAARGAPSIHASTWLHDAGSPHVDG